MRGGAVERGQGLVREFERDDLGVLKIWGF
jgi:hypothetical protein